MLDFKKLENICAIVIIVAFFLPWISMGGMISFSGYELPNLAEMASAMGAAFNENAAKEQTNYAVYLVYLVPLLAIGVLATDYLKTDEKIAHFVAMAAGAFPVLAFAYASFSSSGVPEGLAIGIWLTLLACVAMLLTVFGVIKQPTADKPSDPDKNSDIP